ncbi:oligosaccharide deacetylase [Dictyobacter vulcani]|uniref:Oligosaccharide deacetylase n=1 Tax=Dictyobacter vulcani TaxID=2607529 RepID=A0A5J4KZX7_9CHLR|nr:polysaccharide deacetylase family protein [Dictyobacter vulcani]GER91619.1 oligosaccharide deacetylase [Dictyobacter vulcani]
MRQHLYLLFIIGLLSSAMVLGIALFQTHPSAMAHSPHVALTFDDGPQPTFTPQVLNVLQLYHVQATFFCIGSQVRKYPGIVRQTYQDGDVVGNHTWSHPNLTRLSPDEIRSQIRSASTVIQQVTGRAPTLFRPPYDATNATVGRIAAQLGLVQTEWTIDARDWQRPGVAAIVSTVLHSARNGSIIILHDGGGDRSQTVQALPLIIKGLRQRGFTFIVL